MLSNIIESNIQTEIEKNYLPYAMMVILSRALPDISGFKPSHTKLLYTMYKMGLLDGNRTKCANIVGQTMKLNPHGDGAIYETLVRLTKDNEALNVPFIDSKGNFGKVTSRDMKFAASRYTEAKLLKISQEMFKGIDKNEVDLVPNYDGSTTEPKILPITFPNVLCNMSYGTAVGMASTIIPLNMEELNNGIIEYLKSGDTKEIYKSNFDFSSGGQLLYNEKDKLDIFNTGCGSIKLRAKYRVIKEDNRIEVFEIPYNTTIEAIIDKMLELYKEGKLKEVSDIRDESDLKGLRIAIDYKKSTNINSLMNKLFKATPLQTSVSANMNILTLSGRPKVLGVIDIVDEWLTFRRQCITRGLVFDLKASEKKLHILYGLNKILLDIDKTIDIIKNSETDDESRDKLMSYFKIDKIQSDVVIDIKLRNLNKSYIKNKTKETSELEKLIKDLQFKIETPSEIDNIIINQLTEINKKYGIPRKTEIVYEYDNVSKIEVIEDYKVSLYLTEQGYIKKTKSTASGNFRLKDDDKVIKTIQTNNKSDLFILTNLGDAHRIPLHTMSTVDNNNLGEFVPNLIQLQENEELLDIFCIDDYNKGFIIYAYETLKDNKGRIAKIDASAFSSKVNKKKFANCWDYTGSKLLSANYFKDDTFVGFITTKSKIAFIDTSKITAKSTKGIQGVIGMKLNPKQDSIFTAIVGVNENSALEVFTTKNPEGERITLGDLYDEKFGGRNYFEYFKAGSVTSSGNLLYQFGKSNHKITKVLVDL